MFGANYEIGIKNPSISQVTLPSASPLVYRQRCVWVRFRFSSSTAAAAAEFNNQKAYVFWHIVAIAVVLREYTLLQYLQQ